MVLSLMPNARTSPHFISPVSFPRYISFLLSSKDFRGPKDNHCPTRQNCNHNVFFLPLWDIHGCFPAVDLGWCVGICGHVSSCYSRCNPGKCSLLFKQGRCNFLYHRVARRHMATDPNAPAKVNCWEAPMDIPKWKEA